MKILEKSGTFPFTVFLISFLVPELQRSKDGKIIEKWYRGLVKNQSKFIKSVTSCGGHLARVDLQCTLAQ